MTNPLPDDTVVQVRGDGAIYLHVSNWTLTTGFRYPSEGPYSGQEFRETYLVPALIKAKSDGTQVVVNLDGGYGHGPSFVEEAFGGLVRHHSYRPDDIDHLVEVVSEDDWMLPDYIQDAIYDAAGITREVA
jgi:hypothetical protein